MGDTMAGKTTKTNAVRIAEQAGIAVREAFYEFDENDLGGMHAAEALGMDPEQVFKTLVARGEKTGFNVFCVPVCHTLDLKKAAKAAGDKNMELIPMKDLLSVTGYIRGGCSPVGMKKKFPTFIEETAQLFDEIAVSAGARGHQMLLDPGHLAALVDAAFVPLTDE
ncbi:MAG: Cys-tRNA(Pro) deacylase [Faecousia sp.]